MTRYQEQLDRCCRPAVKPRPLTGTEKHFVEQEETERMYSELREFPKEK